MKLFGREFKGLAGGIVFFVMLLLIAGGLCGLQVFILSSTQSGSEFQQTLGNIFMMTGIVELIAMIVSVVGILILGLIFVVGTIFRRFNGVVTPNDHDDTGLGGAS